METSQKNHPCIKEFQWGEFYWFLRHSWRKLKGNKFLLHSWVATIILISFQAFKHNLLRYASRIHKSKLKTLSIQSKNFNALRINTLCSYFKYFRMPHGIFFLSNFCRVCCWKFVFRGLENFVSLNCDLNMELSMRTNSTYDQKYSEVENWDFSWIFQEKRKIFALEWTNVQKNNSVMSKNLQVLFSQNANFKLNVQCKRSAS